MALVTLGGNRGVPVRWALRGQLTPQARDLAVDLFRQKGHRIGEIYRTVGISKPTLDAYVVESDQRL